MPDLDVTPAARPPAEDIAAAAAPAPSVRPPGRLYRLLARAFYEGAVRPATWALWRWNRGRLTGTFPAGSFVLVANHGSDFDWMLLDALARDRFGRAVRFVANLKVNQNALWRLLIRERQAILVDYRAARRAAVAMYRLLRDQAPDEARVLGVFPEGTRTRTGHMNPPSRGAAWVARKAGVPLVPVALCGPFELWPPQRRWPTLRRVGLAVHVLAPLDPSEFPDDQQLIEEAMRRVAEVVEAERGAR